MEDWTFSSWLYMICVSPVRLDAWFDKSKESLLVCRAFTWCTMFGKRLCCFSKANYFGMAQIVGCVPFMGLRFSDTACLEANLGKMAG